MVTRINSCAICKDGEIHEIPEFFNLLRVTSDSKIWPPGGRIGECTFCGIVQKIPDDKLIADIDNIYQDYNLYFQGNGDEQKIFKHGKGFPRSMALVNYFVETLGEKHFKQAKTWLDLGCGTGHLLKSLSARQINLSLFGADISEKNRNLIESIDSVCEYFTSGLENIHQKFNFLSMSHVLEHVPDPVSFLQNVHNCIVPEGFLFIVVPNWHRNPFDLLITDHYFHYSSPNLERIVHDAGFEIISTNDKIIPKELVLIAHPIKESSKEKTLATYPHKLETNSLLNNSVLWLKSLASWATHFNENAGLLGTALAATWLDFTNQSKFSFFTEEDLNRANTSYLGRPVYSPKDVPSNSKILVPLPMDIAVEVCTRLNRLGNAQYCPPPN